MGHYYLMDEDTHLAHYGIKGQKKGIRRFQNYDGTYTQEGLERYWPGSKHGVRGGDGKQRGMNVLTAQTLFGVPGQAAAYVAIANYRKKAMKAIDEAASRGDTSGVEAFVQKMLSDTDMGPIQKRKAWSTAAAKEVADAVSDLAPDGAGGDEVKDCMDISFNGRSIKDASVWKEAAETHGIQAHAATIQSLYDKAMEAEKHRHETTVFDLSKAFDANKAWQVYGAALLARTGTTTLASDWADKRGVEGTNMMPYSKAIMGSLVMANMMDYAKRNGLEVTDGAKVYDAYDNTIKYGNATYPVKEGKNAKAIERKQSEVESLRGKAYDENGNVVDVNAYKKLINTRNDLREANGQEGNLRGMSQERLDVLKRKQERKINSMYDHEKKWTDRKIRILEKKGKQNKANVWKEANRQNEEARERQLEAVRNMKSPKDYRKSRALSFQDHFFGGQDAMDRNFPNMTTFPTRLQEYNNQRNMRWRSNFTFDKTLGRMTPAQGLEYLDRKARRKTAYANGSSAAPVVIRHSAYYVVDKDSDYGYHIF